MKNKNKSQRYYWIKVKESFMTSDKVDFLMSQPEGANYIVLYQMLCLKAANTNGELARNIGEILIPFDEAKIQRDCKYFNIDTVRIALSLFKKLGMIYEQENGIIKIADFDNMIGSETQGAIEKRIQRAIAKEEGDRQCPKIVQENVQENVYLDNRYKILDIRDKDINNNENTINDIFLCWNSQEIIKHSKLTKAIKSAITGALKVYSCETIKTCIVRYKEMLDSNYKYCEYKWTLENFLKQKNAISEFTDEGSKWNSYLSWKETKDNKNPRIEGYNFEEGMI